MRQCTGEIQSTRRKPIAITRAPKGAHKLKIMDLFTTAGYYISSCKIVHIRSYYWGARDKKSGQLRGKEAKITTSCGKEFTVIFTIIAKEDLPTFRLTRGAYTTYPSDAEEEGKTWITIHHDNKEQVLRLHLGERDNTKALSFFARATNNTNSEIAANLWAVMPE